MVLQVFQTVAGAFAQAFSVYSLLDLAIGISTFACVALAMWSITRFLVLPILGGNYSINDGDTDILTETVTETSSVQDKPVKIIGGGRRSHSVTTTSSRTSRRRVKR